MASKSLNFRGLVDRERRRGVPETERPRTMAWVAETTGVSVPYLYALFNGSKVASDWVERRIAEGFGIRLSVVWDALAQSRDGGGHD